VSCPGSPARADWAAQTMPNPSIIKNAAARPLRIVVAVCISLSWVTSVSSRVVVAGIGAGAERTSRHNHTKVALPKLSPIAGRMHRLDRPRGLCGRNDLCSACRFADIC
jgi:hypothetical protein